MSAETSKWRRKKKEELMRGIVYAALGFLAVVTSAAAQEVRLIVGFEAGGTSSAMARALAHEYEKVSGISMIVESKPGAGGLLAAEYVHRQAPDGKTFFLMSSTSLTKVPPSLGLVAVASLATFDYVFVTSAQRTTTFQEYIANARISTLDEQYASQGYGSFPHLIADELSHVAGIRLTPIPFKGSNPALLCVIGNHCPVTIVPMPDFLPQSENSIYALATFGEKRSVFLPNIPAVAEFRYKIVAHGWIGIFAPPGTLSEQVARMSETVMLAAERIPETTWRIGFEQWIRGGVDLQERYFDDYLHWKRVLDRIESKK